MILKLNPKKTLIVHYSEQEDGEEYLMKDLEKKGYYNCEYVKNEEINRLMCITDANGM